MPPEELGAGFRKIIPLVVVCPYQASTPLYEIVQPFKPQQAFRPLIHVVLMVRF